MPVTVPWDVEREEGSSPRQGCCAAAGEAPGCGVRGSGRGFPSALTHMQMPAPAERMPARCQRSLEFHCFKIFINVKMSLALKPRQYSRSLFAGVEVSDAEKPLSCKYKLY